MSSVKSAFKSLCMTTILFSGCASYTDQTKEIRKAFLAGEYDSALLDLESSGLRSSGSDKLLYFLEKAMILDRKRNSVAARNALFEADRISDQLFTESLSKNAASFVWNDAAAAYAGEDYEKVAIHSILALSFLGDNRESQALVEARKINSTLKALNQKHANEPSSYREDAFARLLAGLIHYKSGNIDSAIIDLKRALSLYSSEGYSKFFRGRPPMAMIETLYQLAKRRNRSDVIEMLENEFLTGQKDSMIQNEMVHGRGELFVFHDLRTVARKESREFPFLYGDQFVRMSFPVIPTNRAANYGKTGLMRDGSFFVEAEQVADMTAIAYHCLEDRRARILAKGAVRLLAKGQMVDQAYRNFGPLAGIAMNVISAASETADTRSWTLLPEAFFVSKLYLRPGTHRVRIFNDGRHSEIKNLKIKAGEVLVFRSSS